MTMPENASYTIKSPIVKSATAITAAAGANSGVAGEFKADLVTQAAVGNVPDILVPLLSLPWGHIASMAAALYTTALLVEWIWKKPLRWLLVKAGLREDVKRYTHEEWVKQRREQSED